VETKVKIGIIGTGNIFGAYARGCRAFDILEIAACADIDRRKAEAKAEEFDIARVCSVEDLLADREIQIIVNLTVPKAHAEVSLAVIDAGKHVYSEKPPGRDPPRRAKGPRRCPGKGGAGRLRARHLPGWWSADVPQTD